MSETNDPAARHFSCSDGERAAFEAGIKLGSLFHQYVGAPLSLENIRSLEKAMEDGCLIQPYVVEARVKIDRTGLGKKDGVYDYTTLTPERLDVHITIKYGDTCVNGRLKYDSELEYPLMWLE